MAAPELPENGYRARAERGEIQLGMAVDTIAAVREVIALGATIVNYSSDVGILRSGYTAAVAEIRNPKETA